MGRASIKNNPMQEYNDNLLPEKSIQTSPSMDRFVKLLRPEHTMSKSTLIANSEINEQSNKIDAYEKYVELNRDP